MNATVRYTFEPACQVAFTSLMDKFYEMEVNRTANPATDGDDPYEGQLMFITKIISNEYRQTVLNCFSMSLQIFTKADNDWAAFPNDEELFISFLFNLLEHSFEIRKNTEDMIIYSEAADWLNYAKAAGSLFQDVAYFEYDVIASSMDKELL